MPRIVVFLTSALSTFFVLWLGRDLPEHVASHFGILGEPDSCLPRATFVALFAVICAVLPTLVWWLQVQSAKRGYAMHARFARKDA